MIYPKYLMSITELTALGYSREELKRYAHHKFADKYVHRTSKNGKIKFDTHEFEKLRSRGALR